MSVLERLIAFSVTQRVFVLVFTAALAAFGYNAMMNLPIEAFPDVQDVQVQVVTQLPGLAPEEVERSVTLPIEREMSGVPRQTQLRSVSITGLSVVTLTFAEGTDDYFARQQVLEKLGNVTLPTGVQPQLAPLSTAVGEIYRYVLKAPPEMPIYEVRAIQDWTVKPTLRIVSGIADVISFGGSVKEYQVRLNPFLLKRYGVTIDQVSTALTNNSANVGGGLLRRGDESLVVRGVGLFGSVSDIARTIVASPGGRPIFVSDVASVSINGRVRSGIVAWNEQDDVVQGIVVMIKGQNASKVVKRLREVVDELNEKLPPGVKLVPTYQRSDLIEHTVSTVVENLLIGAGLVIAILMLFLRNWRASLIVATVIPLSLLFAFILMDLRGVSANLISLGAVDFGIIIDSAVVLVEALMVRLAAGVRDEKTPSSYGWRLAQLRTTATTLSHPILFSKAIIITAFLPIFTFQRVEGKIFTPVTYTLTFALLGAILLTLTLVPTLLAYTLRNHDLAERHVRWIEVMQNTYRRMLHRVTALRWPIVGICAGILGFTLASAPLLGSEFLPKLDEGNIWLTITLPPPTSLQKTKDVEREVRKILRGYAEVNMVVTQVGRPDDGTDPKGPNNLEILADLKPRGTWSFPSKEALVTDMSKKIQQIPGVPTNFSQVIQDNVEEALSGAKGEIVVKVYGPDLEVLQGRADKIVAVLERIRGATDVAAFRISGQSELAITVDRERIARLGINVSDVNQVIQTSLAGNGVNVFYEGDRRFDVTLRLQAAYRDAVDDIANLQVPLPNPAGTNSVGGVGAPSVALGDIASVTVRQGATRITREAGGRTVAVKVNLIGRDQGSFVAEAQKKVAKEVALPPGYRLTWGGQFENQQRAMARLKVVVPLSVLTIFALLFWAFRSVRHATLVLAMVPFTLIGGILGLGMAGLHLSVSAAVGFIAVAGISVQNGVIMVEQILELIQRGARTSEAVIDGAVMRLRPIIMTALMAGLGLLPAALSSGIGSETQRPFAVVIVGGIVTGTIFTLLLLPMLYPWWCRTTVNRGGNPGN